MPFRRQNALGHVGEWYAFYLSAWIVSKNSRLAANKLTDRHHEKLTNMADTDPAFGGLRIRTEHHRSG